MRSLIIALILLVVGLGLLSAFFMLQRVEQAELETAHELALMRLHARDGGHDHGEEPAPAAEGSQQAALRAENEALRQEAEELDALVRELRLALKQAQTEQR